MNNTIAGKTMTSRNYRMYKNNNRNNRNKQVETPIETPIETSVKTPIETPVETPVETIDHSEYILGLLNRFYINNKQILENILLKQYEELINIDYKHKTIVNSGNEYNVLIINTDNNTNNTIMNEISKKDFDKELYEIFKLGICSRINCTKVLSLRERLFASKSNKSSPIEYLRNIPKNSKLLDFLDLVITREKEPGHFDILLQFLPSVIDNFFNYHCPTNSIVTSFNVEILFCYLKDRLNEFIVQNPTPKELANHLMVIDPCAGWGCRLIASAMFRKYMVEIYLRENGFSIKFINEFKSFPYYIGVDTNTRLFNDGYYADILNLALLLTNNKDGGKILNFSCISNKFGNILKANKNGFVFTSTPTPLEIYSNYKGDSLLLAGISKTHQELCKKWIINFYVLLCKLIKAAGIKSFFDCVTDYRISINGKMVNIRINDLISKHVNGFSITTDKYENYLKLNRCDTCNQHEEKYNKKCNVCSLYLDYFKIDMKHCDYGVSCENCEKISNPFFYPNINKYTLNTIV